MAVNLIIPRTVALREATRKQAIAKMREQQMRNAFLMPLFESGTPMIYGGDEFANSQAGNNNAWCQDNAVGWTDWKNAKKQGRIFSTFVKEAIAFRKNIQSFICHRKCVEWITWRRDFRIFLYMGNVHGFLTVIIPAAFWA